MSDWRNVAIKSATWLARLIVGCVFIVSGFAKAVDPWGSFYKFGEYAAAIGIPMIDNLLLAGVFALCALEFLIGVFLVLGCYRRGAPVLALAFMCVMLPLTLWIAVSNPVSDCGCFGDFIILSNWATFWKNVVLTLLIVWLLKFNTRCITIISPAFQWIGAVISFGFILVVSLAGYHIQPLVDFRPYPVGSQLVPDVESGDENFIFLYEKDGVQREFGVDDELPDEDSGWKFIERKNISQQTSGNNSDEKTFRVWDRNGDEDLTDDVIAGEGRQVILLIPDLSKVSPATTWKINALYRWAMNEDADMVAVVAGSSNDIRNWEDLSLPEYEIYTADDTAIKEVARGNPAVISLNDGRIEWKTTLNALRAESSEHDIEFFPSELVTNSRGNLLQLFGLYMLFMAVPLVLTFLPRIRSLFIRGDKARREE